MRRMDVPQIIRALLAAHGGNQAALGADIGVSQATVSKWLSGKQLPGFKQIQNLERIAVQSGMLVPKPVSVPSSSTVLIHGFVGLGEDVTWFEDTVGLEVAELPFPVPEGCVGLECRGDSMFPRVKNGDIVVVRVNGASPDEYLGQEAVVKVRDGGYLLKIIRRGDESGLYNLESHNAPTRENVEIESVAELWAIIPAKRWIRSR